MKKTISAASAYRLASDLLIQGDAVDKERIGLDLSSWTIDDINAHIKNHKNYYNKHGRGKTDDYISSIIFLICQDLYSKTPLGRSEDFDWPDFI